MDDDATERIMTLWEAVVRRAVDRRPGPGRTDPRLFPVR
jgi:hypothetical protein